MDMNNTSIITLRIFKLVKKTKARENIASAMRGTHRKLLKNKHHKLGKKKTKKDATSFTQMKLLHERPDTTLIVDHKVKRCQKKISVKIESVIGGAKHINLPKKCITEQSTPILDSINTLSSKGAEIVSMAKHVRKTWFEACNQEKLNHDSLNQLLGCMTQRQGFSSTLIVDICARYEQIFHHFAIQQTEFKALSVMDQLELLQINLAHFVHYLFGRAVTSTTVQQQLQWLLLTEDPVFITEDISKLKKIEADDLVTIADPQQLYKYQVHLKILGNPKLLLQCSGNVALICLFNIKGVKLESPREVEQYQQLAYDCTDLSEDLFGLSGSLEHIVVMQTLLAMENDDNDIKKEERSWVQQHLECIDLACDQIAFGPEHVKECVMYSMGVPLTRQFLLHEANIWVSRYQQVLLQHDEFHGLDIEERAHLWVSGTFAAFAVTEAKKECCSTGDEQFNLTFRIGDKAALQENLNNSALKEQHWTAQLKCVRIRDWSDTFHLMDNKTAFQFSRLCANLAPLLLTKKAFKLMIMLSMFANSSNKQVFRRYLAALKHNCCMTSAVEEAELERKVHLALNDITELSELLRQLNFSSAEKVDV